ncbi:hypothetical protein MITS9509_01825 [Synechococcus sp. MIT S9509]|nr:hypothetical protein MITS9509_01825 [Synechococcus sp. MIT S9509]
MCDRSQIRDQEPRAVNRWYQLQRITDVVEAISGFHKLKRLHNVNGVDDFFRERLSPVLTWFSPRAREANSTEPAIVTTSGSWCHDIKVQSNGTTIVPMGQQPKCLLISAQKQRSGLTGKVKRAPEPAAFGQRFTLQEHSTPRLTDNVVNA